MCGWQEGKEVNKRKIMEVKISWLIDEVGSEIYDALNQKRKTDIMGNMRRWKTSREFFFVFPRRISILWSSLVRGGKRWLRCMQFPAGGSCSSPCKRLSALQCFLLFCDSPLIPHQALICIFKKHLTSLRRNAFIYTNTESLPLWFATAHHVAQARQTP